MLPLRPGLSSSLSSALFCSVMALFSSSPYSSKIDVSSTRPMSFKTPVQQRKHRTLSSSNKCPTSSCGFSIDYVFFPEQMTFAREFDALTGHTGVICPLLIVGYGVNFTQARKLRARDTVVPLRKRQMDVGW